MFRTDQMQIAAPYAALLRRHGLDSVSAALARVEGGVVAWSRTTETLRVAGEGGAPGLFLKRYGFPSWRQRLRGAFRGTFFGAHRALVEYRALQALRAAGVCAVRPVACGARRVGHFVVASFLITEEVPGSRNLSALACAVRAGREALGAARRAALLRNLARDTAEMHAAGCAHGNLFWRNIVVRDGPDHDPEFFLLDAQPPHALERMRGDWWQRELAQLAVSARPFTSGRERLRFLRAYLGQERRSGDLRRLIGDVERQADAWEKHENRRLAMLELFEAWAAEWERATRDGGSAP